MNNKQAGNAFERELCKIFAAHGFWVHNFANKTNGQPADIIAVKNGEAYLIDAKVCENDVFNFSRIEENQDNAMTKWKNCNNGTGFFIMKFSDGSIYIIAHIALKQLGECNKHMCKSDFYLPLKTWLENRP